MKTNYKTILTNLPGLQDVQVIESNPLMVRDGWCGAGGVGLVAFLVIIALAIL